MHNWASTLRPFGVMCLRRGGSDCPRVGVSEAALTLLSLLFQYFRSTHLAGQYLLQEKWSSSARQVSRGTSPFLAHPSVLGAHQGSSGLLGSGHSLERYACCRLGVWVQFSLFYSGLLVAMNCLSETRAAFLVCLHWSHSRMLSLLCLQDVSIA